VIYGFSPRTSLRLPTQVPRCAGKFAYETTQSACKLGEGGKRGGGGGVVVRCGIGSQSAQVRVQVILMTKGLTYWGQCQ
jgi:hypothetical protein